MTFELRAKHKLAIDGTEYQPGDLVATIQTLVEISNVISAAHFGDLQIVPNEPIQTQQPADTKRVRRDRQTEMQPEPSQPVPDITAELDPDVLNAQPDEQPEGKATEPKIYETSGTTTLAGLPERIGRALIDAGLRDRRSVADWYKINQGFADVEGIGKAAERKILEWLAN